MNDAEKIAAFEKLAFDLEQRQKDWWANSEFFLNMAETDAEKRQEALAASHRSHGRAASAMNAARAIRKILEG